jgi:hypothetical protein
MEQFQMSKFCIDLEGMMLPDAIAAVVEAWYDAQTTDKRIDKDGFGLIRVKAWYEAQGIGRGKANSIMQKANVKPVYIMYNKARVPAVTTEDVQKMNQALAASNGSRLEAFFVRPF